MSSDIDKLTEAVTTIYTRTFDPANPKPLAIGMHRELSAACQKLSLKSLRLVLRLWTRQPAYLEAVAAGRLRYHLDGEPAGEISERHREYAAGRLERKAVRS